MLAPFVALAPSPSAGAAPTWAPAATANAAACAARAARAEGEDLVAWLESFLDAYDQATIPHSGDFVL